MPTTRMIAQKNPCCLTKAWPREIGLCLRYLAATLVEITRVAQETPKTLTSLILMRRQSQKPQKVDGFQAYFHEVKPMIKILLIKTY